MVNTSQYSIYCLVSTLFNRIDLNTHYKWRHLRLLSVIFYFSALLSRQERLESSLCRDKSP